ncbi:MULTISPECIES: CPBP family glutamic-type intramembrane protease [unclassified Sphingomonas]|jgi:uncharacterized protein|nr:MULTISPECIES: CPBP family glutamic-type intramembrane protease [unclassified Sphingomonas]
MARAVRTFGIGAALALLLLFSQEVRDIAGSAGVAIPGFPMPYGGSLLDNLLGVIVVLFGAAFILRKPAVPWRALGLGSNGWRAPLLVAIGTLPAWIGLWLLGGFSREWSWLDLLMLAILYPLAEEVAFRGFGFILPRRALGWRMPFALGVQALLFGLVHWWSLGGPEGGALALQVFWITAIGAVAMALLDAMDGYTIWSGWVLHISLNAAWTVFRVPEDAMFGWADNMLRFGAAGLALLLVWRLAQRSRAPS